MKKKIQTCREGSDIGKKLKEFVAEKEKKREKKIFIGGWSTLLG